MGRCAKLFTTYAYDFLHMFEIAVSAAWEKAPAGCGAPPAQKISAIELVLSKDGSVVEPLPTPRPGGSNKVGMLAWQLTLYTPEYPAGRDVIVIANDITYATGTFGPPEADVVVVVVVVVLLLLLFLLLLLTLPPP